MVTVLLNNMDLNFEIQRRNYLTEYGGKDIEYPNLNISMVN